MKNLKDTKVFKIIKNVVLNLKNIPLIGDVISNQDNQTEKGVFDKSDRFHLSIRYGIIALIIILALTGKISWEEAEQVKGFIE